MAYHSSRKNAHKSQRIKIKILMVDDVWLRFDTRIRCIHNMPQAQNFSVGMRGCSVFHAALCYWAIFRVFARVPSCVWLPQNLKKKKSIPEKKQQKQPKKRVTYHYSFSSIHNQDSTIGKSESSSHLIREIYMTWSVHDVTKIRF